MTMEGLRERGKARRRAAITRAAFELFADRGYDATTIADIAAAAEVSPRTVTLYFRSKQDIALSRFTESADRLTEALRRRRRRRDAHLTSSVAGCGRRSPPGTTSTSSPNGCWRAIRNCGRCRRPGWSPPSGKGVKAIAQDTGRSVDDVGPRIAAAAAAAVIIELKDASGAISEPALDTALAFLKAGVDTL